MNRKKSGIGTVLIVTAAGAAYLIFGGVAKAEPNYLDIWNYSFGMDVGEEVQVKENWSSGEYGWPSGVKLRMYGWGPTVGNPTDHAISPVGIDDNKAYVLEFRLEASTNMPDNKDNAIDLNYWQGIEENGSPLQRKKRNFFMRQHPNSPSSSEDANVYDLLDLTNYFTQNAQIWLPDITAATPRSPAHYDQWQKIVSNYANLKPSVFDGNLPNDGVNWADFAVFANYWQTSGHGAHDNWANGADLDRDGSVNEIDLMKFAEQWLCNPGTIAKAIQSLPQEYRQRLDQTAQRMLDYKG